jgi:type IV fimbrial biogenesis protein FimT
MPGVRGFTLWELVCTLGVAGILVGLGAPAVTDLVLDGRRTADVNGFVLAVQLARSEAAKRGWPVIVCPTVDNVRCAGQFGAGFMVYVNLDDRYPPRRTGTEPLLYVYAPEGTIASNRPYYEFRPGRLRSSNGTLVFCDRRGSSAARAVIVSYTGRPRVSDRDADGRPLRCA